MRDALAAAYKAFIQLKPKLDRVEEEVRRAYTKAINDAKALVIKGASIKQAIDEVSKRIEVQPQQEVKLLTTEKCECECDKLREEYENTIRTLNAEIERLNKLYSETKERLEELINNYDIEVRKDQVVRSLYARIDMLEGDIEKYKLRIKELENNMRNLMSDFLEYLRGNRYVLIRYSEGGLDLNLVVQIHNSILVMNIGELMNVGIDKLISIGINSVVLIDVNDKNVLRPIWKRGGLRVIHWMIYNGPLSDVLFIDRSVINNAIESLGKEFLSALDEDQLRKMINEYRRLRSGMLE